jgi:hypothetical protein
MASHASTADYFLATCGTISGHAIFLEVAVAILDGVPEVASLEHYLHDQAPMGVVGSH